VSPVPGTLYLIDTSAAARMIAYPTVLETIEALIDDGVAATCITVDLEAGFSVREPNDVARTLKARAEHLTVLPISEAVADRAREVQAMMASRGLHRAAGAFDLLTAAVAEHHRATVLHYDADFEHIASVTGQQHRWIAPRGSLT
jgi:predicted nucleic acid-binding protein